MTPAQTDVTTPCVKCSGVMKITAFERATKPGMMQHTFACACGESAKFNFNYPRRKAMRSKQ